MDVWFAIVVAVLGIVVLYVAADRRRTVAVCVVERRKVRVARGRLPAEVLAEIEDVVRRGRLETGRVVLRRESGTIDVRTRGIHDENAVQQLRNAIGRFPPARFRS